MWLANLYTYTDSSTVRVALAQRLLQIHFWEIFINFHGLLTFVRNVN
jgi:hypothetical protein